MAGLCASCSEPLSPDARFCAQCGAPVRASIPTTGNATPETERRHLTVLFCDLVGSTSIAERLDPEDWRDVVVRFQEQVTSVIERAGGYVAQHLGDGLLVYFGYPRASEDDSDRAVRCGLALVRATHALNPELHALYDVKLNLRVGMHRGPVVVGEVGGTRRETLALGSTANVAARVQGAAEPDTVYITDAIHQRVAHSFSVVDKGEHQLKGIQRPERLYAVSQAEHERTARASEGLTPFINRVSELALVSKHFADVERGHGRAIAIGAEPGMGKSRLAHAFRASIEQKPHAWYECRGAPYNRDSPLQPWVQLQREVLAIGGSASNDEKLAKLEQGMRAVDIDASEGVPLFAALHGLELAAPYVLPALSPLGVRKKTLAFFAEWLLRLAGTRSMVLLIEDLHWLDPSSLELLDLVLPRLDGVPLLLLLTHRPSFEPPWAEGGPVTRQLLARLEAKETRRLIGASAAGGLSDERVDAILARAEGVPLYAEELARAVLARQTNDAAEPTIPDSLEDSLMSRLEQEVEVKSIAQIASVLGREFPLSLLEGFWSDEPAKLYDALRLAEQHNVLLRVDAEEPTYYFRHALIRDAAYNSLLRKTRRRHHFTVARTLRAHFPEVVQKQPELLAHHLTEASEVHEAIEVWIQAAKLALQRAAYEEAVRHLRKAQELVAQRPGDPRALDIAQMMGGALVMARGWAHEETRAAWEVAASLCDPAKQPLRAGAIACGLGDVYSSIDLHKSLEHFTALIEAGERQDLPLLTIAGHQGVSIPLRYLGRYEEARAHLDAGIALYDPAQHQFVASGFHEEKGISLLCWSAWLHWDVGALDLARRDARRAIELSERFQNPFALALSKSWAAIVESFSEAWPEAIALGESAAKLASEQGFALLEAMGKFAELSARGVAEGKPDASALFWVEIQRLAKTGNRLGGAEVFAVLANMQIAQGATEHALATIEMGLGFSQGLQQPWCDAWLWTLQARCLLASGNSDEAEALLWRALALARAQKARSYELRTATVLGQHLLAQARKREAIDALEPALRYFENRHEGAELAAARRLMTLLR